MPQLYEPESVMRMSILQHTNFTGIQHINVLYFAKRGGAAIDADDLDALETDWSDNGANEYSDIFPTAFEIYQVDIRGIFGGVPPAASYSWNQNGNRIVAGDYLPPYSAAVLSYKPNLASRRWHGRNFYGGLVEADQVNGSLNSSITTPIGAFAVVMINRFGQAGASAYQWVVMSDPDRVLPLAEVDLDDTLPMAASVDSYHVGSFVRTQKRRDFGRGN